MMMKEQFQRERLKLARQIHGLKQVQIAERLDVSRQFLHQIESGARTPNDDSIEALADLLQVESSYFFRDPAETIGTDNFNFRKLKTTTKSSCEQVIAKATAFLEIIDTLDKKVAFPKINFPSVDVSSYHDIEKAAEQSRYEWGLSSSNPISSMTRVAEHAGSIVVNIPGVNDKVSALSVSAKRPIVIHNEEKDQPTRLRYDIGHELGHFIMHAGITTGDDMTEGQANYYSGALMLPRIAFIRDFPRGSRIDWNGIFRLKQKWKVSAQAIIRRAYNLNIISAPQYKSACIYISKNGYRKKEPFEPKETEKPELIGASFETLRKHFGLYKEDIAKSVGLKPELLESILGVELKSKPVSYGNVISLIG